MEQNENTERPNLRKQPYLLQGFLFCHDNQQLLQLRRLDVV